MEGYLSGKKLGAKTEMFLLSKSYNYISSVSSISLYKGSPLFLLLTKICGISNYCSSNFSDSAFSIESVFKIVSGA